MGLTVIDASKGIYKHTETGFVLHEIYSVADALECNGCLACDDNGWAWVAGRDLMLEVRRFGAGGSLLALAQSILRDLKHSTRALSFSQEMNAEWNSWNTMGIHVPGYTLATRATSNPKIFGIITNVAAGRGCSISCFNGRALNAFQNEPARYLNAWKWKSDPTAFNSGNAFAGSNDWYCDLTTMGDSEFIGRAVVALPLTSWEKLLVEWANALPNNDQSEVQEKIAAAKAIMTPVVLKAQLGVLPTVFVPLALYSDGTAAVELNHAPVIGRAMADSAPRNSIVQYSPYLSPSVPEIETGWWITNPLGIGKTGHLVQVGSIPNGGNLLSVSYLGSNLSASANYNPGITPVTAIDNIDLFKMLGGLYPRLDATKISVSSATIINRSYIHSFVDESLAAQGAGESTQDYLTRQQAALDTAAMEVITTLPNHWSLLGQPTFIATTLLNGFLNGAEPKITQAAAALLMTGHYSAAGRVRRKDVVPGDVSRSSITASALLAATKV